ncbi:spermatogenesis-associated protein 20 [Quaeritorhiza haematococci]|nr:spermatogenesis-associated protein 20 [Quaeritorhiza haematococci]
MEHESFENEGIAKIMNEHFVNIKVDREERPNVDRMYMTFVQLTTGHGGWPMSVWLTPDLKPFLGGTYFAPEDKYGMPGFPRVLKQISDMWKEQKPKLLEMADDVISQLQEIGKPKAGSSSSQDSISWSTPQKAFSHFLHNFDSTLGGFSGSPKFPTPVIFHFLLRFYRYTHIPTSLLESIPDMSSGELKRMKEVYQLTLPVGITEKSELVGEVRKACESKNKEAKKALEMVEFTLKAIARGGIHDHVGLGFHRYSVDKYWHVPHFEKMLYDQAQLLSAYIDLYTITKDPFYADIAKDIIQYVDRDLKSPEGGFYSAEDADSFPHHGAKEKKEGAFAVWERDEIFKLAGSEEDAKVFAYMFGVNPGGNVNPQNDPHGELTHKNVLIKRHTPEETASHFHTSIETVNTAIQRVEDALWKERLEKRPKPHRDDKIITSWNGLMISALARAAQVLQPSRHAQDILKSAVAAAEFFEGNMYDGDRGVLKRSWREGASDVEGFADDYAFMIQALLDLYEATFNEKWLSWAVDLQKKQDELFWDSVEGGYFSGSKDEKRILLRLKEDHDGAEPSPNSITVSNLLRLDALIPSHTHPTEASSQTNLSYRDKAAKTILCFYEQISKYPQTMPALVAAQCAFMRGLKEVVIHGDPTSKSTQKLLSTVRTRFIPNRTVALAPAHKPGTTTTATSSSSFLYNSSPTFASIVDKPLDSEDAAEAHVCHGFECGMPVGSVEELVRELEGL